MIQYEFNCPACGQKILGDAGYAGSAIACPLCQVTFVVPRLGVMASASAPAAPAPAAPAPRSPSRPPAVPLASKAKALGVVPQVGRKYCGLAIASLISSVVAGIGWLPGIVCGHMARARFRRDPLLDGEGMATAGLAISYLGLILQLGLVSGVAAAIHHAQPVIVVRNTPEAQVLLARRIVDEVMVADPASEREHGLNGGATGRDGTNRWRGGQYGQRFAYQMKVLPDRDMTLNCHFSDDPNQRHFDIVVENQVIGGETFKFNVPGHFYDVEYKIPASLTSGKQRVTVEFRTPNIMLPAKLFGCQMLKPPL